MNTISVGWVQPEHTLIIHTFGAVWRRSQTRALWKERYASYAGNVESCKFSLSHLHIHTVIIAVCVGIMPCPVAPWVWHPNIFYPSEYGCEKQGDCDWPPVFWVSTVSEQQRTNAQINIKACSSFIKILFLLRSHLTVKMLKYSSHLWASEYRYGVSFHFFLTTSQHSF